MTKKMGLEFYALDHLQWRSGSICGVSLFWMEGIPAADICVCVRGLCNIARASTKKNAVFPLRQV